VQEAPSTSAPKPAKAKAAHFRFDE
jgi:hypothetical protein